MYTPEQKRAYARQYYLDNKETLKAKRVVYYKKNQKKIDKKTIEWQRLNKDKVNGYQRKRQEKNRVPFNAYKEATGCLNPKCEWKGKYTASMLDFHHIGEKTGDVSQMINHPERQREEIKKCTLLCANCHRLVTYNELDITGLPLCKIECG